MFSNTQAGGTSFAFPDTLLTPMGPLLVPVPYPNNAQSAQGVPPASNVFIQGMPAHNLATKVPVSDGANPGVAGASSGTVAGAARPVTGAYTVLFDGMPVTRLTDATQQNSGNIAGSFVAPSQSKVLVLAG